MFLDKYDTTYSVAEIFSIDCDWSVPGFKNPGEHVPKIDKDYYFDLKRTKAILAGFKYNRRVLLQGFHGTGKSSNIEQVAARLNWPCIRINLDSHISRVDLIGSHGIVIEEGKQITKFQPGILAWAITRPIALILDEYDAGRPDVMFVLQRVLEQEGQLTLLSENEVLLPHPCFRIFATANTVGLGDSTGLYQGTQILNQGQLDRWNIIENFDYLLLQKEVDLIAAKFGNTPLEYKTIELMVRMAELTRQGFAQGDLSIVMSPRTVINWCENVIIFDDAMYAFKISFFNRCEELEQDIIKEYYFRCFGSELS